MRNGAVAVGSDCARVDRGMGGTRFASGERRLQRRLQRRFMSTVSGVVHFVFIGSRLVEGVELGEERSVIWNKSGRMRQAGAALRSRHSGGPGRARDAGVEGWAFY